MEILIINLISLIVILAGIFTIFKVTGISKSIISISESLTLNPRNIYSAWLNQSYGARFIQIFVTFIIFSAAASSKYEEIKNEKRWVEYKEQKEQELKFVKLKTFAGFETLEQLRKIEDTFECNFLDDSPNYIRRVTLDQNLSSEIPKLENKIVTQLFKFQNILADGSELPTGYDRAFVNCLNAVKTYTNNIFIEKYPNSPITLVAINAKAIEQILKEHENLLDVRKKMKQYCNTVVSNKNYLKGRGILRGYVVKQLAPNEYEVNAKGETWILKTTKHSFTSRGNFELPVNFEGVAQIRKTAEAGGFDAQVGVVSEDDTYENSKELLTKAQTEANQFKANEFPKIISNLKALKEGMSSTFKIIFKEFVTSDNQARSTASASSNVKPTSNDDNCDF